VSLRIEETFQLQAPADRVWTYLTDPRQVVTCLPGAELTSVQDESTFFGKVKVKVGPVTAAYSGKVIITERDDVARVVRVVGEGRESAGAGSAKMTMTSALVTLPSGATEVRITADVDIVGKLVQFGRGMIESVNKQLFKQFTVCVRATLEPPAGTVGGERPATGSASSPTSEGGTPDPEAASVGAPREAPAAGGIAPPARSALPPEHAEGARPARAVQPVRLLPILLRAAVENVVRLMRALWQLVAGFRRRGK